MTSIWYELQFELAKALRKPAVLVVIGVAVTLVLVLVVGFVLLLSGGAEAVSDNAALLGALLALGGVFTTQLANSALEAQRAQDAALQRYLEQMGKLLADPNRPLHRSRLGDSLSTIARAQTLAILKGLGDPTRKRILLQFLYESRLIYRDMAVVDLRGANLDRADLSRTNLRRANLQEATLRAANLSWTEQPGANLRWANLQEATLSGAYLVSADLSEANLSNAGLSEANLSNADLNGAILSGANLRDAIGVTQEQLEEEATTLTDATMPDGSKHD